MYVTPTRLRAALLGHPLRIVKAVDAPRRFVLGVAYGPNDLDGHEEFMTPQTVEDAAWSFMDDDGRQIGLYHADGTLGHARVVESSVYRGPDWEMTDAAGGTQVVKAGDWLLGAIFDPQAWAMVLAGKVQGWSIDGAGRRRPVTRSTVPVAKSLTSSEFTHALERHLIRKGTL